MSNPTWEKEKNKAKNKKSEVSWAQLRARYRKATIDRAKEKTKKTLDEAPAKYDRQGGFMLYDTTAKVNDVIKNIEKESKEPETKDRRKRQWLNETIPLSGGEENYINEIINKRSEVKDGNLDYMKALLNDFAMTSFQSQPEKKFTIEDMKKLMTEKEWKKTDDNYKYSKLFKEGEPIEREMGFTYGRDKTDSKVHSKFYRGDYPSKEDIMRGILGSVQMPDTEKYPYLQGHSHPFINNADQLLDYIVPSQDDFNVAHDDKLINPDIAHFLVDHTGRKSYYDNPNPDSNALVSPFKIDGHSAILENRRKKQLPIIKYDK